MLMSNVVATTENAALKPDYATTALELSRTQRFATEEIKPFETAFIRTPSEQQSPFQV